MSLASLVQKVRLEFHDLGVPFTNAFVGDGANSTYDLSVSKVQADTVVVSINGVVSSAYTLDDENGVLVTNDIVPEGQRIIVAGVANEHFSDIELQQYVLDAFTRHVHGQIPPVSMDNPPPTGYVTIRGVEEPMVVWLATIEALWALATSTSMDINITTPEGMMIPRGQRFQQILMLIQMLEARYKDLAQALNVGVHRIQMFDLRRVSRTTNRLVPIYLPKEYDDITYPPTRVLPPIDPKVT